MANVFRLQYNGLTIEEDSDAEYFLNELDGVDEIPIRTAQSLLTGGHGGHIWEQKFDMRTIGINGVVSGSSDSNYRSAKQTLRNAFSIAEGGDDLIIRFWDGTERQINAYIVQMPDIVERVGETQFAEFRAEFLCPVPFFESTTETTLTLSSPSGGGTPLSTPIPSPVGGATGNSGKLTESGTFPWYATEVEITGAVTNPSLTNATTGQSWQVEETLGSSDTLRVYTSERNLYVEVNGSNVYGSFTGTYFQFASGTNTLIFGAATYGSGASCTITYKDRYLGL